MKRSSTVLSPIKFAAFALIFSSCVVTVPINTKVKKVTGSQYEFSYDLKARPTIATYAMAGASIGTGAYLYKNNPKLGLGVGLGGLALDWIYYSLMKKQAGSSTNSTLVRNRVTKYNKENHTKYSYPTTVNNLEKRGRIVSQSFVVYDIQTLEKDLSFKSEEDILSFKSSPYGNKLNENIILNTDPCLWKHIQKHYPNNSYAELLNLGDMRCSPEHSSHKIIQYLKAYPNSKYANEVEEYYLKYRISRLPYYSEIKEICQTRPSFCLKIENEISSKLYKELYDDNYSGIYYEFISNFPKNKNVVVFKKRADELKKREDEKVASAAEKRRTERESQERSNQNNNSSSTSNKNDEKIKVKLIETKEEINVLSANRMLYKYRLRQGSRSKNIEVFYTPKDDSWTTNCSYFGAPRSREEAIEKCLDDFDCNGCDWEWEY